MEEFERERLERVRKEKIVRDVELWLCNNDNNVIVENHEISNCFKTREALDIVLRFIVDPFNVKIDYEVKYKNQNISF